MKVHCVLSLLLNGWLAVRIGLAQQPFFQPVDLREVGSLSVTALCQDSQGWLWVGAREGLFLFDGHKFRQARLPIRSERRPIVSALGCWKGKLWVGLSDGTIAFWDGRGSLISREGNEPDFHLWAPEEGLPRKAITGFATDTQGRLWIATYGEGLYYYDNHRLYNRNAADEGLASDDVYAIASDQQGHLWAATDAGISIVGGTAPAKVETLKGLPDLIITALVADHLGNIWIGTHEKGICCYQATTRQLDLLTPSWPYGPVTTLAVFGGAEVWAGTEESGLVGINISTGTISVLPQTHVLGSGRIKVVYKDREGMLWVGTERRGLHVACARVGRLEVPMREPLAVAIDARQRIWVGGTAGLFLGQHGQFRHIAPHRIRHVVALWVAPGHQGIWAGTYDQGAFLIDTAGQILQHFTRVKGLPDDNVLAITGNSSHIYLATFGGVAQIDAHRHTCQVLQGIPKGYVYAAFLDSYGRFWFGTQGDGVYAIQNGQLRHYTVADHPALKTVYSITEAPQGQLWFSTERGQLLRFDGNAFHTLFLRPTHGLPIALQTNADSLLVIGFDDGFQWLPIQQKKIKACPITTDLPPMSVGLNATCRDSLGHVWLATSAGIWRIAAWKEHLLTTPLPVITAVRVLHQQEDGHPSATLAHNENYLEFTFDAIWYTQHSGLSFRYRLEGFDRGWTETRDHQVHYSQLPPGRYTFCVMASKCGDFEGVPEAQWTFTISAPWWERWWFRLSLIILGVGLLYGGVRVRIQQLQRKALQHRKNTEAQLNALKAQVNPHFLFNSFNTLAAVIEENPALAIEYVNRLSDFYRSLLTIQMHDYVSIHEERARVNNFAFLLRIRYGEGFVLDDRLDAVPGLVIPLSLLIPIENAVKHNIVSAHRPLVVELFSDEEGYVVVRNNLQLRATPAPGTRLGLQNLIKRYQLLGAPPVIVVKSNTYFTVKIPLKSTAN